jgi:hypothetical protein
VAPVKYLFEMAGLYPAIGESQAKPEEASLAKTLLDRLGIQDNPVIQQNGGPPPKLKLPCAKPANADAEERKNQKIVIPAGRTEQSIVRKRCGQGR